MREEGAGDVREEGEGCGQMWEEKDGEGEGWGRRGKGEERKRK